MSDAKPFVHVLIVYDLAKQEIRDQRLFEESDDRTGAAVAGEAAAAYLEAERDHLSDRSVEIVLVGADSLETIQSTHRSYFTGQIQLERYDRMLERLSALSTDR